MQSLYQMENNAEATQQLPPEILSNLTDLEEN
jgi:hypothetical protein